MLWGFESRGGLIQGEIRINFKQHTISSALYARTLYIQTPRTEERRKHCSTARSRSVAATAGDARHSDLALRLAPMQVVWLHSRPLIPLSPKKAVDRTMLNQIDSIAMWFNRARSGVGIDRLVGASSTALGSNSPRLRLRPKLGPGRPSCLSERRHWHACLQHTPQCVAG